MTYQPPSFKADVLALCHCPMCRIEERSLLVRADKFGRLYATCHHARCQARFQGEKGVVQWMRNLVEDEVKRFQPNRKPVLIGMREEEWMKYLRKCPPPSVQPDVVFPEKLLL